LKLESIPDLYFVISVFVPGFIYHGVLRQFVPLRQNRQIELILLSFLTATAFNYALCSPIIFWLITGHLINYPIIEACLWFTVLFIVPILLAIFQAQVVQKDWLNWIYRILRLRPINPIPTGWDWIFSRTGPCFLLVTLKSGTSIAGYFGELSMASSDPESQDIFIEKTYIIGSNGQWAVVNGSEGVHINGSEIAFIEFRK
jgi:hypothetical protein